jgi:hypothetical protein
MVLASFLGLHDRAAPRPAEPGPRWLTDYAEAQKAARQSGKPIFVVFR